FLARQRRRGLRPCVLRIEAERALHDVDDFGDAAIPTLHHDALSVRRGDAPLLRDELHGLRLENLERLVEVFVVAEGEPMRRRLDAGPFERSALDHIDGDVELLNAVSMPVRFISPLPCAACASLAHNSAPLTNTGR